MENKITDQEYNANWDMLLKMFHGISGKDAKEKYNSLKELCKKTTLTPRQHEGIMARCDYRISLIDNPEQIPFSNMERKETRTAYQLSNSESNGQPK